LSGKPLTFVSAYAGEIIDAIKHAYKFETDKELSAHFGVSSQSVANARKKVPIDWIFRCQQETDTEINVFLSNSGLQSDYLIAVIPFVNELIEVRGSDTVREKGINHILVRKNGSIEYRHGILNEDRPQRASEVAAIRKAYWQAGCRIRYLDGTKTYLLAGQEVDLFERLKNIKDQDGDIWEEIGNYIKYTGMVLQPVEEILAENNNDVVVDSKKIEVVPTRQLRSNACECDYASYLPETAALANILNDILKKKPQVDRSIFLFEFLGYLNKHYRLTDNDGKPVGNNS
jgi:hypothetical protein